MPPVPQSAADLQDLVQRPPGALVEQVRPDRQSASAEQAPPTGDVPADVPALSLPLSQAPSENARRDSSNVRVMAGLLWIGARSAPQSRHGSRPIRRRALNTPLPPGHPGSAELRSGAH